MSHFAPNTRCVEPPCSEQVHLQLGGPGEMVVVFASAPSTNTVARVIFGEAGVPSSKLAVFGTTATYSQLVYWYAKHWNPDMGLPTLTPEQVAAIRTTSSWASDPKSGLHGSAWENISVEQVLEEGDQLGNYKNPSEHYNSPQLHTVVLRGLRGGQRYEYSVDRDDRVFSFVMPEDTFPFTFGVTADVDQTEVTNATFQALAAMAPGAVLLAGDLAYANGYYPRWDSFGKLAEALSAAVPTMTCPGNHETGYMEAFQSYKARYPMPAAASGSTDPTYWSRDIGPAHVISLNSYAGTHRNSAQYRWLEEDLASRFDRRRTPWLVVMMHAPWYSSNTKHLQEPELMRGDMETLLYSFGANVVVSGHVHSYERTAPMYNNASDPCGTTYLNLGDGGKGKANVKWLPGEDDAPQPEWSLFRQASFGVGKLELVNDTHAYFRWHRHSCYDEEAPLNENFSASACVSTGDDSLQKTLVSDETWIVRPSVAQCKGQEQHEAQMKARPRSPSFASLIGIPSCGQDELLNTTTGECIVVRGPARRLDTNFV
eukprot:CAMPEP_0115291516 /NCGR_PEP_ID=MMETSP0270-20121206/64640_1 /TAXON_ID=71861 /ORGANISM="Scrippsiella trochoidea, Strain CCMP3099" /LENGTH=541 /DNA_ID=CAMNT_0002708879 /DNA_START=116 /DNA_END=1741 /DNA_ORIENTATION=+